MKYQDPRSHDVLQCVVRRRFRQVFSAVTPAADVVFPNPDFYSHVLTPVYGRSFVQAEGPIVEQWVPTDFCGVLWTAHRPGYVDMRGEFRFMYLCFRSGKEGVDRFLSSLDSYLEKTAAMFPRWERTTSCLPEGKG